MSEIRSRTKWSTSVGIVLFAIACRDTIAPRTNSVGRVVPLVNLSVTLNAAKQVTLAFVCGNRFRVRNPLTDTVRVHWDVYHTPDSGSLILPPRPTNAQYSETFFATHATGTARLFFQGTLLQTAKNSSEGGDSNGENGHGNDNRGIDDPENKNDGNDGHGNDGTVCPGNLVIVAGAGVLGLQSGSTAYTNGTRVSYSVQPAIGYNGVRVFLDATAVPVSGTIEISGAKTLVAFALLDTTSFPTDPGLIQRFRSLLTSSTQVADYQSLVYAVGALVDQVGLARADTLIHESASVAFHLPRDSAALVQLEQNLAAHTFDAESLPPIEPALPFGPGATLPYGFPSNASVIPPLEASRIAAQDNRALTLLPGTRVNVVITPPPRSSNPRPVNVVHVNGLRTTCVDFLMNIQSLRGAVREQVLLRDSRHARVTGIFNVNTGLIHHLVTHATACAVALNPGVIHYLPWWIQLQLLPQACTPSALQRLMSNGGGDLLEALTQLGDIYTESPPSLAGATLNALVATQLQAKQGGDHVIVVPHSQGNLFEIESLSRLAQGGNTPTDFDAACVGMVPTASPTSTGYPSSTIRLKPVQVQGDIILNLPGPKFPAFPTQQFLSMSGDFAASQAQASGSSASYVPLAITLTDQLILHGFVSSYLATVGARSLVQQAVTNIYANCEFDMTVTASPLLLIGSTEKVSVTLTSADGSVSNADIGASWLSSDTTIASVDGHGFVTGIAEGMVHITATYRGQHADAIIEVVSTGPDASVTVTVTNSSSDVLPFWLSNTDQVWRRRDVTVSVTPNDSTTSVAFVGGFSGYDSYGTQYFPFPVATSPTSNPRTVQFSGVFFDNPRKNGTPLRFETSRRLWIMGDAIIANFQTLGHGVTADKMHWVRVVLAHP